MTVTTIAVAADDQFDVVAAMNEEVAQLESVVLALRWDDPESAIAAELSAIAAELAAAASKLRDPPGRRMGYPVDSTTRMCCGGIGRHIPDCAAR